MGKFDFYDSLIYPLMQGKSNYTDKTREKVSKAIHAAYQALKAQTFDGETFVQYVLSALKELEVDANEFLFLLLNYWSLSVLEELSIITGDTKVEWEEPRPKYEKKTKFLGNMK